MKDAITICSADPKNLADIFIGKYKGNVSGPNLTEACTEINGGASKGYCDESPFEDKIETSVSIPGSTITGFKDCSGWVKPDPAKNEWKGKCRAEKKDCKKIQDQIVAIYESARQSGKLGSSTQANPMPDFCSSSDNSGRDNPKSNLPGPGTNPVDQNNGGYRGQGT
jgi:hypothetical protein